MRHSFGKLAKGFAVGSIAAAMASTAFAATDGVAGFTSTGTLDISIQVDDEVQITNLADITLGIFGGTDASGSSPACIYRNSAPTYQITGTGNGAANAFTLTDGTNTVPYSVSFTDSSPTPTPASVTSGVALTGQAGADTSPTCATAGNNATIAVTVAAADAATLPAGAYAGTLTLVVAPN